MLKQKDSLLLIIDVQEKLVKAMPNKDVEEKTRITTTAATKLNIPIILTEQYPKGLGSTVESVKNCVGENSKFCEKTYFNVLKENGFEDLIKSFGKKQIIISGIETHICVLQT